MPLCEHAVELIRANLEALGNGERVRIQVIGRITDNQLRDLNRMRAMRGLPAIEDGEVLFLGRHLYKSRITQQEYTIEDVISQILSAMSSESVCNSATSIRSTVLRDDGYGNRVKDKAVFECTDRRPRIELNSVIPEGDVIKPRDARAKNQSRSEAALVNP